VQSLKIKEINKFHNKAMDLAELAFIEDHTGASQKSKILNSIAYELERLAALGIDKEDKNAEPSRVILCRSAAFLAFLSDNFDAAEEMVAYALECNPPAWIIDQLDNLMSDIKELRDA
jgi:hypothetical protein